MHYNYYQPFKQEGSRFGLGLLAIAFALLASIGIFLPANANNTGSTTPTYQQGFESDTSGWMDSQNGWYGSVERVESGTDGVASSDGDWHAIMTGDDSSAPFSRFDEFRDTWTGTYIAELDVYLDPTWADGSGYDYSVASSDSDGNHLRDFIFHVAQDSSTGELLVAGSNNTEGEPRQDLETLNSYTVTDAGWYTMQHVFYDEGGQLAVDLNLLDADGNVLFTETRSDPADTIPDEVGGNRYAWFTFIELDDGLAVDQQQLTHLPQGQITSPLSGQTVTGTLDLAATYVDGNADNDDAVQWAVRSGTCDAGTDNVAGNVDGFSDEYTWDGSDFAATLDVATWETGEYCFIFNPTDDANETDVRETVVFTIQQATPTAKADCKKGGWQTYSQPSFRNQGDCVSYMASENQRTNNPDGQRGRN